MKKRKLQNKKQKNSQVYFKIASLLNGFMATNNQNNETVKQLKRVLIFLFIFLLPTQLGKHFFLDFSYISGVRVDYLAPTLYLTDILAFLLILLNLKPAVEFFRQKKILIVLSLLFINILLAQFHPISIYRFIKIIELLGIFAVFKNTKVNWNSLTLSLFMGAGFQLLLAVLQFINKHSLQGLFYLFGERNLNLSLPGIAKSSLQGIEILRPYGTFSHPNSLSGFYLLVYFFVLTKLKNNNLILRNLLLLFSTILVFLSFSKITIIAYIFLNIFYLWNSKLKKSCTFCFVVRLIILLTVPVIFLSSGGDRYTIEKRIYLLQNASEIIKNNPFSGVGLGKYLYAQANQITRFGDMLNQPVHNIFLYLTAELGWIMVFLLLLILRKKIQYYFKNYPYLCFAFLFTGFFDHYWITLQQNFLLIGVFLALL